MFRLVCLWMALAVLRASAGFSSIYVFGDGVSNTNNAPTGLALSYHENRYCNGRVFVEVLSGWQGVVFDATKNVSDFENGSGKLVAFANSFIDPGDAADSLFIVWANNADFVDFAGEISLPYGDMTPWNSSISLSLSNHIDAISTLYDKGARKIVMPLAVDVMSVPNFNAFLASDRSFVRQRIIDYNQQFKTAMTGVMAGKPGLEIILPDTFTFFEQVLANPGAYGMINFTDFNAGGIDSGDSALNGAGAQYVFWDDFHPTAKFQMHLADFIQQIISPVKVNSLTVSGGNVNLQVANIPMEREGFVQGSANLQPPWVQDLEIDEPFVAGGSTTKTYTFAVSGPKRFYRVGFPVVWVWP